MSDELLRIRDQQIRRFEAAWGRDPPPSLSSFASETAADPDLLYELVHIDLEFRLKRGEPVTADRYLADFPQLKNDRIRWVELVTTEYEFRRRTNPALCWDDYQQRLDQTTPAVPNPSTRPLALGPANGGGAETNLAIPGFEFVRVIGRGGMGVVYQARHVQLQRFVAVKLIRYGASASPEERARFREETLVAVRLRHPNIVPIFDVGEHQGQPYCVLEYLEGGSLAEHLAREPYLARESARLVETLARGMAHAHGHGVIHRDLKPANILLTADGTPKIGDFGLAKQLAGSQDVSVTGQVLGTPAYMSPEQTTGRRGETGPATDVYSLGIILYELLTGRPPFRGESIAETLEQVRNHEPVSPRRLQPALPRDLETICLKCIAKDPLGRFASADDLAADLARFLADEPIRARPASAVERGWRWVRRHRLLSTAAGLAVAGLLATVVFSVLYAISASSYAEVRKKSEGQAKQALWDSERHAKELALTNENRRQALRQAADLALGQGSVAGQTSDADEALHWFCRALELAEAAEAPDLARLARLNLRSFGAGATPLAAIAPLPSPVRTVVFSPDGASLLAATDGMQVLLIDARTGEIRKVAALRMPSIGLIAYRHDGQRFYIAHSDPRRLASVDIALSAGRLASFDAGTGELLGIPQHVDPKTIHVQAHPTNLELVLVAGADKVQLWNVEKNQAAGPAIQPGGQVLIGKLSPDGKFLGTMTATSSPGSRGSLALWNPITGERLHELPTPTAGYFEFAPDSSSLTMVFAQGAARISLPDFKPTQFTGINRTGYPDQARYSPDSKLLWIGRGDGSGDLWDLANVTTPGSPSNLEFKIRQSQFSPRDPLLAFAADGTVQLWDAGRRQLVGLPLRQHGSPVAPVFSPDGTWITATGQMASLRIWPAPAVTPVESRPRVQIKAGGFGIDMRQRLEVRSGRYRVVEVATDREVYSLDAPAAFGVTLLRDGSLLVGQRLTRTVERREIPSGTVLSKFGPIEVVAPTRVSLDGRWLIASPPADRHSVQIWDIESGQAGPHRFEAPFLIKMSQISPDRRRLALVGEDEICVWDCEKNVRLHERLVHNSLVKSVAFSPDGRWLLAGDRTEARLWDVDAGRVHKTAWPHDAEIYDAVFSPDGQFAATVAVRSAFVWSVPEGRLVAPVITASQDRAIQVRFSDDSRLLRVGYVGGHVLTAPIPVEMREAADHLALWVRVATGQELKDGRLRFLDRDEWLRDRQSLDQRGWPNLKVGLSPARTSATPITPSLDPR